MVGSTRVTRPSCATQRKNQDNDKRRSTVGLSRFTSYSSTASFFHLTSTITTLRRRSTPLSNSNYSPTPSPSSPPPLPPTHSSMSDVAQQRTDGAPVKRMVKRKPARKQQAAEKKALEQTGQTYNSWYHKWVSTALLASLPSSFVLTALLCRPEETSTTRTTRRRRAQLG